MAILVKHLFVSSLLVTAAGTVGWTLWQQDLQYALPTPRPAGLVQPPLGKRLALPMPPDPRPTLLTFYNPSCPCSRFNVDHQRELQARFEADIRFVAVCPEGQAPHMESVVDRDGRIARLCGVYATPQAVLLDAAGNLYFRGNFNRARYCREPQSEYARLAIEALLKGKKGPRFPVEATTAYGCPLPR